MKKFFAALLLILPLATYGNPNQLKVKKEIPIEISRDRYHRVVMVKSNKERFTKNWAFIVDSSHSTWAVAGKILRAFHTATGFPADHLRFCSYVFNNEGWTDKNYRDWVDASPDEFLKTQKWIRERRGVNSNAAHAVRRALRQPVKELTILIISDGGFSDGGVIGGKGISLIKRLIKEGQNWRVANGLSRAIICTIGIENVLSWPTYPKLPNAVCQQGMRDIGVEGRGGFFYVHRLKRQQRASKLIDKTQHASAF